MHLQGDLSHTGVPMKLCRPMHFLSHPLVFPCLSGREVFQNSPSISLKELRGVLRSSGILRSWTSWPLKMGPIDCLETSVQNYHSSCVISQQSADLIYNAAAAWTHASEGASAKPVTHHRGWDSNPVLPNAKSWGSAGQYRVTLNKNERKCHSR